MSQSFNSSKDGIQSFPARGVPEVQDHTLLRPIARGGYGEVWLAQSVMGTYRAVKVVYRGNFSEERPFLREFEGIQRFEPISREHPGLVDVLQVGRDEQAGCFYYVMELADDLNGGGPGATKGAAEVESSKSTNAIPGPIDPDSYTPKTLRSILHSASGNGEPAASQRHSLPVQQCLELSSQLASALEHLHKHNLVHRDVKPSNIIFVNGVAKLADIGLVAAADGERSIVGTEGFMAPEGPGVQSDIFALGKVLYEMTTGLSAREYPKVPDDWASSPERERLYVLNQVILRACEGGSKRRYTSAVQMRSDLESLINGQSLAMRQLRRTLHRQRWVIASGFFAFVLICFIAGFWYFKNRAAEEARQRILREIQISQMQLRDNGWFSNSWSRLQKAAAIRKDQALLEQASSLLAGWDARLVHLEENASASSAAFSPDGRVLVAGAGQDPALLIDTNGSVTRLPLKGEGPVCWTPQNIPVQLTDISNRLVLRDELTGIVRKQFGLEEGLDLLFTNGTPVMAIAPDGDSAAAVCGGRILVWNCNTGGFPGPIPFNATAMAFSPDGSLLGAGDADGMTRVYSVPSLAQIADLHPALRGNPISCLAFTKDRVVPYGKSLGSNSWLLAVGDCGTGIVVWDLDGPATRCYCRGSDWTVTSLAFSPDGQTLASAGRNQARLWDAATGQALVKLLETSSGESTVLAYDKTGGRLVCGGLGGAGQARIDLWELYPDHGMHCFAGLASSIRKVWYSEKSELVAALSDDWHVGVWSLNPQRLQYIFETPTGVYADNAGGCFDPTGKRFAFSAGHEAVLYDLANGNVLQRWELLDGLSDTLRWDAKGRLLLLRREPNLATQKNIWRLYSLGRSTNPTLLHEQSDTNWIVRDVAVPEGARRFVVWSGGPPDVLKVVHVYDTGSGRELWKSVTKRTGDDLRVRLDPTGESFGYDCFAANYHLRLIRFSDLSELGTSTCDARAIGPLGKQFACVGLFLPDNSGIEHAIPCASWKNWSTDPVFSPNAKLLAWGTTDGSVFIVDTQQLQRQLSSLMP